jgi:urease accessory protein
MFHSIPTHNRHAELVSAPIVQPGLKAHGKKWALSRKASAAKRVQGDEIGRARARSNRAGAILGAVAVLLAPTAAWAHPGHDGAGGLYAGVAHPLTGIDHLVAMLLVGVWAGLLAPRSRWAFALPAAFLGAMLTGFAASAAIGGTFAEPLILLSLVALGVAAAFRFRAPVPLAMATVAVFGFAHGLAHGFETPSGAFPAIFAAGFAISTAVLYGIGLWLVRILPASAMRLLGAAGAGIGLLLASAG